MSHIERRRREQERREALVEQHQREDAAPRLRDVAPNLEGLRLSFEDVRPAGRQLAPSYSRPIVVSSAPAMFEIRCLEARCDGRHQLTETILAGLRQSQEIIKGESNCTGVVADELCDRTLSFVCEATYRR
jgi:hypothetical protein